MDKVKNLSNLFVCLGNLLFLIILIINSSVKEKFFWEEISWQFYLFSPLSYLLCFWLNFWAFQCFLGCFVKKIKEKGEIIPLVIYLCIFQIS